MIVVTGASGKLGHHVIQQLLTQLPASEIVAAVRSPEQSQDLASLGVQLRHADYARPGTLAAALAGAEKLLLISSTALGQRLEQHSAVIDAARSTGVKLLAYTSILRAHTSTLALAAEHKATEQYLQASGLPFVLLRNGWYLENHTETLAPALEHGAILGAAGDGRFASASRADYAGAAVAVLTTPGHENKTYELAGDRAFTLSELAAAVSTAAGRQVVYNNLPPQAYEAALTGFGLPAPLASVLADADANAAKGELESTATDLSTLLGRPTTTLATALQAALQS